MICIRNDDPYINPALQLNFIDKIGKAQEEYIYFFLHANECNVNEFKESTEGIKESLSAKLL